MRRSKRTLLAVFVAALTLSVNVYAANSYGEDFDDGNADGWTPSGGSWSVSNTGESSYYYEQTDSSAEFFSHGGETIWTDYSVEAKIKRIDTTGWGSCDLIGRRTGEDCYLIQIGPSTVQIWNVTAANSWVNLAKTNTTNALDTWYTYKLEMVGNVIKVYKDGIELMSATDPNPILSGQIGFRTYKASARFDDIFVQNLGAPWPSGQATSPYPSDGKTDVPQDVVLTWTPGEFAPPTNGHTVYFSEIFEDVNDGVGGITQSAGSYVPSQHLDFGATYYWRVDEVNGPPDFTVHSGDIWSFTTEPVAYPIGGQNITATASDSFSPATGPENTVNGSGLDADDLHSDQQTEMWMTGMAGPQPGWIQYEFDKVYKLHEMWVWNFNQNIELLVGFGLKDVTIEYSSNGSDWTELAGVPEFAQALGTPSYAHDTTIDFGGVSAKYVKLTVNDNWGFLTQYGLSEVRFCHLPVLAREPHPDSGATDVGVDAVLNWRAGREAARHDVYFSADEQAVVDGTAPVATTTEPGYVPLLDLASTYYWRVDEANDVETPATWQGNFWSFSTQEYLVVDDFESYNDIAAGEEDSNLIYMTWIDGFDNPSVNGSTMGYTEAFQPSMERSVIYDGRQSAPLFYDNTTAAYSEVTVNAADLGIGRDWAKHGVKSLTVRLFGDPSNVPQQMYVKLNGAKVEYDGSADDTRLAEWQMWYIDLASIGVNLSNITELVIGFERMGAAGGRGMVLLDGIRLYSYDRKLSTPVDPGTAGLQAHYEFEGNTTDSSGNARQGTAMGSPVFEAGRIGQAITLDGISDYVNIDGYKGITAVNEVQPAFSIACWIRTVSAEGEMVTWGSSDGSPVGGQYCTFRVNEATLRAEHGEGNLRGNTPVNDGQWHHVALTVVEGGNLRVPNTVLYVDGRADSVFSGSDNIYNLTADADVNIGRRASNEDRYFNGSIDDAHIYDRVLLPEEITWLAGRIEAFDKPF